jgi:ribosomal protein S15P/S13E
MRTIAFDTYPYIKNLETKGGFSETQAESIIEAISGAQEALFSAIATKADIAQLTNSITQLTSHISQFATKTDLAGLRTATETGLAGLRTELAKIETKIAHTKSETIKWMLGCFISIAGLMAALHFIH